MAKSTINNLTKLHFFNSKGIELQTYKQYNITWTLIPHNDVIQNFKSIPSGYFIANVKDRKLSDGNIVRDIDPETLECHILNPGELYYDKEEASYLDTFMLKDDVIQQIIIDNFFYTGNFIKLTVTYAGNVYENNYNVNYLFAFNDEFTYDITKIYYGDDEDSYNEYINITNIPLMNIHDVSEPIEDGKYAIEENYAVLYYILAINTPNIGMVYPFVKYQISLYQDTCSTGFTNSDTILILQEDEYVVNAFGKTDTRYVQPYLHESYDLLFSNTQDSELYLLDTDDAYTLTYNKTKLITDLFKEEDTPISSNPFSFIIGTTTEMEGCYQNYLAIYLQTKDNKKDAYFMGAISVKSEFIGEDERFRTLLTNFGIPDPIKYSNLFSDNNFEESLPNYEIINNKSKELFLTYTDIFSYIGTYKALINAVKFLGYNDIIFKEWYKINDINNQVREISTQVVDLTTNTFIQNALKEYNISIDEYTQYTKLNKLSMIYHLNEINENIPEDNSILQLNIPTGIYENFIEIINEVFNKYSIINKLQYKDNIQKIKNDYIDLLIKNITYIDYNDTNDNIQIGLNEYKDSIIQLLTAYNSTIPKYIYNDEDKTNYIDDISSNIIEYIKNLLTEHKEKNNIDDCYYFEFTTYPNKRFILNKNYTYYECIDLDNGQTNTWNNTTTGWYSADISKVIPIFKYRNTEIISKLHSVKNWLEKHIIGVNAYIKDISAEGICLHYMKTTGYVTKHILQDFEKTAYYTPKIFQIKPLINSQATIRCTLSEFGNALFEDYDNITFNDFIKYDISLPSLATKHIEKKYNIGNLYISNTISTPVLADEYEYELTVYPENATLFDYMEVNSNQIYISDNEITLLSDSSNEAVFAKKYLPIISLENANIRKCFGKWDNNIEFIIREIIDSNTGNTLYELRNIGTYITNNNFKRSAHIRMLPDYDFVYMEGDIPKYYKITGNTTDILFLKSNKTAEIFKIELSKLYIKDTQNNYINDINGIYTYFTGDSINMNNAINIMNSTEYTKIYVEESKASLSYTTKNKWHVPMFIITGYKFEGCDNINGFDIYDKTFILDIINGRMLFNNNDKNMRTEIIFENRRLENFRNIDEYEQQIYVKVSKNTDIVPISYINKNILDETKKDEIYSKNIQKYYSSLVKKQITSSLIIINEQQDSLNYQEYQQYIVSDDYIKDLHHFCKKANKCLTIKSIYQNLFRCYENDALVLNNYIDIDVNNLGKYSAVVKVHDCYNNIFVNNTSQDCIIDAPAITYNIITTQPNSNNVQDFYKYNKDGQYISYNQIESLLEESPKFPITYAINNLINDNLTCTAKYDSITYAQDTPKNNDYFVFSNLTEICTGVDDNIYYGSSIDDAEADSFTKINMLDENPNVQNLYIKDASVRICIYDESLHTDVSISNVFEVVDFYKQDASTDINYSDDSFIKLAGLDCGNIITQYSENIKNSQYKAYMINVSQYKPIQFENNYDLRTCDIYFDTSINYFNISDLIKVTYYKDIIKDINTIVNQALYRIIDQRIDNNQYIITINGLLDEILLNNINNADFKKHQSVVDYFTISYPYSVPVYYTTRVEGDANEYDFNLNYYYKKIITEFKYNNTEMFISDYLDNTFSGYLYTFDLYNLQKHWVTPLQLLDVDNLYMYEDFPVSVPVNQLVILYPDTRQVIFKKFVTQWDWSVLTYDDTTQWKNHINTYEEELLFSSRNAVLQVNVPTLNINNIKLTCIDIYGNTVSTKNNAKIYGIDSDIQIIEETSKQLIDISDLYGLNYYITLSGDYYITLGDKFYICVSDDEIDLDTLKEYSYYKTHGGLYLTKDNSVITCKEVSAPTI